MRSNCNLELRLVPSSAPLHFTDNHHQPMVGLSPASLKEEQLEQLTIFYNGSVRVCDVTELQARAIIMLASQEISSPPSSEPSSPLLQTNLNSPTGLSVKRSLQRFLQKRKNRIQAVSPYQC